MERKSIQSHVLNDMWTANLMAGDGIRDCVLGEKMTTADEKIEFCRGIFCTFPHILLMQFSNWMWPEGEPRDYQAFMDASLAPLQEKVFPELDRYFKGNLPREDRAELMAALLTKVIPQHVLTGYYSYMYESAEDRKDITEFWQEVQPLLNMTADVTRCSYDMDTPARAELFLYLGGRYPFLLLKRWYDWQYGRDVLEMGPPPSDDDSSDR